MKKAAENLTPVALELGGETGNWCIVRKDADLRDAARKIAFIKVLNAGQICININQVAVAEEVAGEFIGYLKEELLRQAGAIPFQNAEYPRLIAKAAYERCAALSEKYRERIIFGGEGSPDELKYSPLSFIPWILTRVLCKMSFFVLCCPSSPLRTGKLIA